MSKKAQAEFVVIVGILLVIVTVVYYAVSGGFGPSDVPGDVYGKQKAVHDSFVNMVRKGADKTLSVMEAHGAYPTAELLGEGNYTSPPFVIFMNEGVPYWVRCEQNIAPSKSEVIGWFERSMENYIRENIKGIEDSYRSENATFDLSRLSVSASIPSGQSRIDVTVSLPTRVKGYSMSSSLYPYKAGIGTKFGEIYDFASSFSKAQASKRFLDVFTTASVYMSKEADDGHPKLPTGGVLTECGETIFRSPAQISAYLKEIAEYIVTQVVWWGNMPVDPAKPKVYAINREVLGSEYRDLEIGMHLPDGFVFDSMESVVITNTDPVYSSSMWDAWKCLGVYRMSYSVSYPVVVRVKDPLTGYHFNFAVLVFVDDKNGKMQPGKCGDAGMGEGSCQDLNCYAKIRVEDERGATVEGAAASFGKCGFGSSDSAGKIEGRVKCDTSELVIFKTGYGYYRKSVSSSEISGTYVLRSLANVTANFRSVEVTGMYNDSEGNNYTCEPCGGGFLFGWACPPTLLYIRCDVGGMGDYAIAEFASEGRRFAVTNIDSSAVPENCMDSQECRECTQSGNEDACKQCSSKCLGGVLESGNVDYMPSGYYSSEGRSISSESFKETGGFINSYFNLRSSAKDIYIYLPKAAVPDYQLSDGEKSCLAQKMMACGIEPVSENLHQSRTVMVGVI